MRAWQRTATCTEEGSGSVRTVTVIGDSCYGDGAGAMGRRPFRFTVDGMPVPWNGRERTFGSVRAALRAGLQVARDGGMS